MLHLISQRVVGRFDGEVGLEVRAQQMGEGGRRSRSRRSEGGRGCSEDSTALPSSSSRMSSPLSVTQTTCSLSEMGAGRWD